MSRPTPRRPASSRGSTPRPRKLAGQDSALVPDKVVDDVTPPSAEPQPARTLRPSLRRTERTPVPEPSDTPDADAPSPDDDAAGLLSRPRTTRVLIIALALVALVLAGQAIFLALRDDDKTPPPKATDTSNDVSVPDGRPVVASGTATVEGVDAAAKAAQEIVAVDYKKYDDEVAKAADLMTSRFEEQYRATAGDIQEKFVIQKTVVQANVVAQGVVRANRTKLQALVFLNQVVSRERDGKPETVVTPFKVLVTMVHTDQGWLVDGLDTDQRRDKTN